MKITGPEQCVQELHYGDDGRVDRYTDPDGYEYLFEYDAAA